MNLRDVVSVIAAKKIWLWNKDGALCFATIKGAMDSDTRNMISEYRNSLLEIVSKYSPSRCLVAPATINQSSLAFIQKLTPDTAAYNVAVSFRLSVPFVLSAFESACENLYRHHMQFRASFLNVHDDKNNDHIVCQIVKDFLPADIKVVECTTGSDEILRDTVISEYKRQFDLETGPLIRWTVFNAASISPVVLITIHHSIIDAWSIRIMVKEFFAEYSKRLSKPGSEESGFIDQSSGYIDFALYQQERLKNGSFNEHLRFFKEGLNGCIQSLNLKTDFPRPEFAELRGESISFIIPADLYSKTVAVAQTIDVTINTVLLTAFMMLLYSETGQQRFTVGMPVSNRTLASFHNIIGYFINTIVIPFRIDGVITYGELVKAVHAFTTESMKYQDLPFPCLVEHLNPQRDTSRAPIFQVLFNFLSRSLLGTSSDFLYEGFVNDNTSKIEGIEFRPFPIPQQEGQYDLTLEIIERKGYACGQMKYSTALFLKERIEKYVQKYLKILHSISDNISEPLVKMISSCVEEKNRIVVAASFTANTLAESLDFWCDRLKSVYSIEFADYGQVLQQLLNPASLFRQNNTGFNVILLRLDDLFYAGSSCDRLTGSELNLYDYLLERCNEIFDALSVAAASHNAKYIVLFCPSAPSIMNNPENAECINKIQSHFTELFNGISGVYASDTKRIFSLYPYQEYHDPVRLEHGHIPYTQGFFTIISTMIIRSILVMKHKPIKVIAVDCDNTLWNGVAAEDGSSGVSVDAEYQKFHRFLIQQQAAGRLIVLVSKNRQEDIEDVFDKNESMILSMENICSKRINWQTKSENICSLAEEINVGLDSFMFIDDNPVECAEVSAALPQVNVVQFPKNPDNIDAFLNSLWILDILKTTDEDRKRAEFYKIEKQRTLIRSHSRSFEDFLRKLDLEVSFESLNENNGERLSQLTYRTNQFNFTGLKHSYQELCKLQNDGNNILAVSVKDRFGDYGIVGMMIFRIKNELIIVENYLLSCRVLGRGVEHRMVRELAKIASENGSSKLHFNFIELERNRPALEFLSYVRRQCNSKKDNVDTDFDAKDAAELSAIADLNNLSDAYGKTAKRSADAVQKVADDIQTEKSFHEDICANLATVEMIINEAERFFQRKYGKPEENAPEKAGQDYTENEKKVLLIWRKILHKDNIGSNDNFFDVGGSSLQLPELLAELKKETGTDLNLIDLFRYTTISSQAKVLDNNTMSVSTVNPVTSSVDTKSALFQQRNRMLAARRKQR